MASKPKTALFREAEWTLHDRNGSRYCEIGAVEDLVDPRFDMRQRPGR